MLWFSSRWKQTKNKVLLEKLHAVYVSLHHCGPIMIIFVQLSIINCQRFDYSAIVFFRAHLHTTLGIQLKYKQEVDGKLPFLDTLLHRKNDGSLDISIYRKPTYTDRHLNFSSHHPCHDGWTAGPTQRESQQRSPSNNIYPICSRPEWRSETGTDAEDTTSEQSGFRSASTLRGQLTRVKDQDPLEKKSEVVYQLDPLQLLPCVYRGDEDSPRDPHKGTQSHHQTGETEKAIAEHAWGQHHRILWKETSVLNQAKNNTTLLIKEALHMHPPHRTRTDQQRRGRCHSGMLATSPGSCRNDELHPRHATPRNWSRKTRRCLACYVSVS